MQGLASRISALRSFPLPVELAAKARSRRQYYECRLGQSSGQLDYLFAVSREGALATRDYLRQPRLGEATTCQRNWSNVLQFFETWSDPSSSLAASLFSTGPPARFSIPLGCFGAASYTMRREPERHHE